MGQGATQVPQAAQANLPNRPSLPSKPGRIQSSGMHDGGRARDPFGNGTRKRYSADDFAHLGPGEFNAQRSGEKAQELCSILKKLEHLLEEPNDYIKIGGTYRQLSEWTWEHSQDSDFGEVLALLAPESMYPAWRRQALEEAYMLFFEDCAKQGNPQALDNLPEPPTSKEIGYRPLPEALLDPKTTRGAAFSHMYESGSACCVRRRWDYDVIRNGPRPKPGEKRTAGRKIVAKDSTQRYCACATDPLTKFVQAFTPDAFCCGRDRKGVEDAAAAKASSSKDKAPKDAPTWPPRQGGPSSKKSGPAANVPAVSAQLKPKPFRAESAPNVQSRLQRDETRETTDPHPEMNEFPKPPGHETRKPTYNEDYEKKKQDLFSMRAAQPNLLRDEGEPQIDMAHVERQTKVERDARPLLPPPGAEPSFGGPGVDMKDFDWDGTRGS